MRSSTSSETPNSVAEETASTAIQATGTLLSVVGLVVLVRLAMTQGEALAVASVGVYGGTLVFAFLSSALYHGSRQREAKRVFRTLDHCAIYLLIAGTYTPIAVLTLPLASAELMLGIVWAVALAGTLLRLVWPRRLQTVRVGLYVALGWLGLAWGKPVFDGLGPTGTGLLVAGGLAYTSGIVFYRWRSLPYNDAVWHLFVIMGSALHYAAIAFSAIPAYSA